MRVLSIDMDYFYPDSWDYDWGHKDSPFFANELWFTRCSARSLITGERAIDAYVPRETKGFWKSVLSNKPALFYIADSHLRLYELLRDMVHAEVVNLDAHHDLGYNDYGVVTCDNWAHYGKEQGHISTYSLWYPEWRRDREERSDQWQRKADSIGYGLPEKADYDLVFLCRSGCWTPPWFDSQFRAFVRSSGLRKQLMDEDILDLRSPSLVEARRIADEMEKVYSELRAERTKA